MTVNINGDTGISQVQAGATVPDLNVDSGTLYVDPTNNRVGIGTSSPSYKLDAVSSGTTIAQIKGANSSTSITSASVAGAALFLTNTNNTTNSFNAIYGADASENVTSGIAFINNSDANNEGTMAFMTRPSGGSLTERVRIDSNGYVIKPNQVAFLASNASSGNPVVWAYAAYNYGNGYNISNGRFTAPVSGRYLMYCNIHGSNPDGGTADFRMQLNGGDYYGGGASRNTSAYAQATGIAILGLNAGDYVTIRAFSAFTNVFGLSSFGGYLLG